MLNHKLIYIGLALCILACVYQQSQAVPEDPDQTEAGPTDDPAIANRSLILAALFFKKLIAHKLPYLTGKLPHKTDYLPSTGHYERPFEVPLIPHSGGYTGRRKTWLFALPHERFEQIILIPRKCLNCKYRSVKMVPDNDYLVANQQFRDYYGKCNINVLVPEGVDIDPSDYEYVIIDSQGNYDFDDFLDRYHTVNADELCPICNRRRKYN